MSLIPYMDAGWNTVPLRGKLERLSNGDKTTPIFPKDFKTKYTDETNEEDSPLGGCMTGPCSGIIAIDCDSEEAYTIFRSLDPDYEAVMMSKGKLNFDGTEMVAGTIIYKYSSEVEENFIVKTQEIKLDFYSTKGFIYLPTAANKTKVTWDKIPEIKDAPPTVLALLKSMKPVKLAVADAELKGKKWSLHLGPQISKFIENKKVTKALFKILTPKDFRDEPTYIDKGYLHPNDVVEGRGSDYLMKVSAILGADESIDEEVYQNAMGVINELFSEPMNRKRMNETICIPMMEERSKVDGVVIWRYNKDWETNLTNVVTKLNSSLSLFYDMQRKYYFAVDAMNEYVHEFKKDTDMFTFIDTVAIEAQSKKELKTALPLVNAVSTPQYSFGFFGDNNESFNLFKPTMALSVFKNPELYTKNYNRPETILAYFEYLIPDNYMRNYLFKFLRRKLDTFDYSPVIIYLLGVSGSGKDLFVSLLEDIIGDTAIAKPSAKEFMETHNGWVLDKYFAQLDEYGDQVSRYDDKELVKGKIKSWSGKSAISVRIMRTDSFQYHHNITFIMTANKNPITFDADDRRVALFSTPNILRFQPMVEELGLETFVARLKSEVNDFVYYLRTERESATLEEYMSPPETADKQMLIASKLSAGAQIAYYLSNGLFEEFEKLCRHCNAPNVLSSAGEDKIFEDELFDMYSEMTDDAGNKRGLSVAMQHFDKIPTTKHGSKSYYYRIPNLRSHTPSRVDPIKGDFEHG